MPIVLSISVMLIAICGLFVRSRKKNKHVDPFQYPPTPKRPFSVAEYLDRIEKAQIDILSQHKPVDQTITLWWGLDGVQLNEDGNQEWISRKEKASEASPPAYVAPLETTVSYQNTAQAYQNAAQAYQADLLRQHDLLRQQLVNYQNQTIQQIQNQILLQQLSMQTYGINQQHMRPQMYPMYPNYQVCCTPYQMQGCV